jgi:tungstate transport system ATP-binding protein
VAETFLSLQNVCVQHGATTVLDIAALDIHAGEVLAVIGPNGAGKSTLLRVLGLLQKPDKGRVYFAAEEATSKNALRLRRRSASVFQQALLLNASVYENAALGLKIRGFSAGEIKKRLGPWLERFGLAPLASRPSQTLSGGEAQRTSLARAFALNPNLLLLDEPFAALDAAAREALLLDLRAILSETGVTTVLVTHDRHEAFMLGHRVGVLQGGKLLQLGAKLEVFTRPVDQRVAEIVGMHTRIPGVISENNGREVTVCFTGGKVKARGNFAPDTRVVICIRPEEIKLTRPGRGCTPNDSNGFRAKVASISPWISHYRIELKSENVSVVAFVDGPSFLDLAPRNGEEVLVFFAPDAAHVIAL